MVEPPTIMTAKLATLFLALGLHTAALLAQPPASVQLRGVMVANGKTKVCLVNEADGHTAWVAVGGRFGDYIVDAVTPAVRDAGGVTLVPDRVVLARESNGARLAPLPLVTAGSQEEPPDDAEF